MFLAECMSLIEWMYGCVSVARPVGGRLNVVMSKKKTALSCTQQSLLKHFILLQTHKYYLSLFYAEEITRKGN